MGEEEGREGEYWSIGVGSWRRRSREGGKLRSFSVVFDLLPGLLSVLLSYSSGGGCIVVGGYDSDNNNDSIPILKENHWGEGGRGRTEKYADVENVDVKANG